jgi:hypothetical protein
LEDRQKLKKLLFLQQGINPKIDRDLRIRRFGTPVNEMENDIPSPPPQKNSKSLALLPCQLLDEQKDFQSKKDQDDLERKIN